MEKVDLKYGGEHIELEINGAKSVEYLKENPMNEVKDVEAEFKRSVEEGVIDSKPLKELISADDKVTIVISDMTRFWMRQDIICELLVKYLNENNKVPFENMAVVVALGTHRKNSLEELEKLASSFVYSHVSVTDHDCDAEDLVYLGTTSLGTEVRVNPLCAGGRKVICIGGTVHHIMAGYGGGRKSILPGVSSRLTIKQNHTRALDPEKAMTDIKVGSGKLGPNPIHEDMDEAAALVNPVFGINIVVNTASKLSGLFCGNFHNAWLESCRYQQKCYGLPIENEADIVIASCGGYPKDINLYQSTKSLFNATRAVKKGGILILLAECREGGGAKDFFDWNTPLKEGRLDEALRKDFTIGGYIFYAACESIRKSNVLLLGKIDPEEVKDMGIKAYDDINKLLENVDFKDKSVYIMPYGGSVMPQKKDEYEKFSKI